jgi:hypothetical protein
VKSSKHSVRRGCGPNRGPLLGSWDAIYDPLPICPHAGSWRVWPLNFNKYSNMSWLGAESNGPNPVPRSFSRFSCATPKHPETRALAKGSTRHCAQVLAVINFTGFSFSFFVHEPLELGAYIISRIPRHPQVQLSFQLDPIAQFLLADRFSIGIPLAYNQNVVLVMWDFTWW